MAHLRQGLEVLAEEAPYCLHWRISNALATERVEALPSLVPEFAAIPDQDIDVLNRTGRFQGLLSRGTSATMPCIYPIL